MKEQNTNIEISKEGFIYINKPSGITSHDIVDKLRKITGEKRVGHAGTLDPFATGLLIVGVGRQATKQLSNFLRQDKTYVGTIYLGAVSTTDDPEGKITKINCKPPAKETVEEILNRFVGETLQTPPKYSAIKIKGRKSYELARRGKEVELNQREIKVHYLKLKNYRFPRIKFETRVGSGTYIRALARDVGKDLGCGAYLVKLTRTRIGDIDITQAQKLE